MTHEDKQVLGFENPVTTCQKNAGTGVLDTTTIQYPFVIPYSNPKCQQISSWRGAKVPHRHFRSQGRSSHDLPWQNGQILRTQGLPWQNGEKQPGSQQGKW